MYLLLSEQKRLYHHTYLRGQMLRVPRVRPALDNWLCQPCSGSAAAEAALRPTQEMKHQQGLWPGTILGLSSVQLKAQASTPAQLPGGGTLSSHCSCSHSPATSSQSWSECSQPELEEWQSMQSLLMLSGPQQRVKIKIAEAAIKCCSGPVFCTISESFPQYFHRKVEWVLKRLSYSSASPE